MAAVCLVYISTNWVSIVHKSSGVQCARRCYDAFKYKRFAHAHSFREMFSICPPTTSLLPSGPCRGWGVSTKRGHPGNEKTSVALSRSFWTLNLVQTSEQTCPKCPANLGPLFHPYPIKLRANTERKVRPEIDKCHCTLSNPCSCRSPAMSPDSTPAGTPTCRPPETPPTHPTREVTCPTCDDVCHRARLGGSGTRQGRHWHHSGQRQCNEIKICVQAPMYTRKKTCM
jgi:hypothetical protein